MCFQAEVSARGRFFVQMSPTVFGVPESVCEGGGNLKPEQGGGLGRSGAVASQETKIKTQILCGELT